MKIQFYKRADGKWAWRMIAANSQVIATDGGQGYENYEDAVMGAVLATDYSGRGIEALTLT